MPSAKDTAWVVGVSVHCPGVGERAGLARIIPAYLGVMAVAVHAWVPVGGELAYVRAPCPVLLEGWEQDARDCLRTAFDEAFGGVPAGLEIRPVIGRSQPGPGLVALAARAGALLGA